MNELQRILQAAKQLQKSQKRAVLATVVQTSGSVYRRPGARMLLTDDGQMIGAISGGCLESDLLERSRPLFSSGDRLLVRYDTTSRDDIVFGFGLGCNGTVDILLEPLDNTTIIQQLAFMEACLNTSQVGAIATVFSVEGSLDVQVGDRLMMSIDPQCNTLHNTENVCRGHWRFAPTELYGDLYRTLIEQKNRVQPYAFPTGTINVLLDVIRPPVPLLIFGAGHDAIPVVELAKRLGWHVTVIDPRSGYVTPDRFPQADRLICCQPEQFADYHHLLTAKTVAVVMTHRYLSDLAFLKALIPARLRYLGVLGPKHRMQRLWQDLADQGIIPTSQQRQHLYNPVGLDLGAETPEEIALSIIAEIQAVISGRSARFLRDRVGSIHSSQSPCLERVS
ncbi:XdhC family protein [Oscillatoria sp. FACHB-1407]|uniref:XdhC family protein n=1 Tax=Oscillatoria sp. FACHB-1407 TaxID=2692847 RepID=UPI001686560E|nr:XdhC/CoxI family protein [Oscillatoria sp. FACHB-1407]MBD2461249.1 XdhC family protein [Oscillatoria sp. FACHB-1407]